MTCTANSGLAFEKEFSMTQNPLDCSSLMVPKILDLTIFPFTFDFKSSGTQFFGDPILLETGKWCVEYSSKRISYANYGHTVASCNDLCNADSTCV